MAVFFAATAVGAYSQTRSMERDLSPFEGIEASAGFQVSLSSGDTYSVRLTMDDALESYVQCYVKAGVLHLGLDSKAIPKDIKNQYKGRNASEPTLVAVVKLPALKSVTLADNAVFTSSAEIATSDFTMNLGGSSAVTNLKLTGKSFNLTLAKNARFTNAILTLEDEMNVSCDGKAGATIECKAKNVKITGSGSAEVNVNATVDEKLVVDSSSYSKITVSGAAESLEVFGKGTTAKLDASAFGVNSSYVSITGISVDIKPEKYLELDLGRGAEVTFAGEPAINIVKIQSASVTRK